MSSHDPRNIVYIEDDQEMIDLVSMILSRRGFEVKGVQGGLAGLDYINTQGPDLILLDLMMPDVDGWDIFQQMKSNEDTKDIPVIIVTAKAQAIDKVLGLQIAKANDYICKPFRPQELLDSIDKVLGPN
ncbi:MAG: response regulator transcription factor [Bellilinea sp.]